jgi:hypothetical protein
LQRFEDETDISAALGVSQPGVPFLMMFLIWLTAVVPE